MSPSPNQDASEDQFAEYRRSWQKITDLTRAGKSFSGRERNCCYLNTGGARFANVSATSGFDFLDDSRGLGLVDWDHDGDLDVWASNRNGPQLRFLRNESPPGRHFVGLKLTGRKSNRDAIGARVEIELTRGTPRRLVRSVRAGNGFLSQSSKRLHFGLGERTEIAAVTVRWPSGERETMDGVTVDGHFELVEGAGIARRLDWSPRAEQLTASRLQSLPAADTARIVLGRRVPPPRYLCYQSLADEPQRLDQATGKPRLILLWSTSCRSCLKEMAKLTAEAADYRARGLEVLALNVDGLHPETSAEPQQIAATLERLGWPYTAGIATPEVVESLTQAQQTFVLKQAPLSLPTSFLLDSSGQLAIIYQGPVEPKQLTADLGVLNLSPAGIFQAACPFPGRWQPVVPRTAARTPAIR